MTLGSEKRLNFKVGKTVVFNLGSGNLNQGFPHITVRLWTDSYPQAEQFIGNLPAAPELVECYRIWQATYRALHSRMIFRVPPTEDELEIDAGGITHVSQLNFEESSLELRQKLNTWLKSEGLLAIERQLRSHLHPADEIRVIFEVNDDLLQRLPWDSWDFFQDYPRAEMALSRPEYKRQEVRRDQDTKKKVRILAVLGDRRGIDVELERQSLQSLEDAETRFLMTPTRQEFNDQLWDAAGWDILFFAGHSQTEAETGRIYINENPVNNSLTIEQLASALSRAIENGLSLAIFNSCDGVGLAQALGKLQIPGVIVMREPVPNRAAQEFLRCFLEAFAIRQLPLYLAIRQAREKLQGLEDEFPGVSWLPVICQNPAVEPLTWLQLGGKPPCPYRGLFAFGEKDAHLFFGRQQFTQDLVSAVTRKALVAVVGPSGSGKSSVVFAGLVPQLGKQTGSTGWRIISFRPGMKPFDALAEALMEFPQEKPVRLEPTQPRQDDAPQFRLSVLELVVNLQQDPQTLCHIIARLYRENLGTRLLLIVDQFEELYTLCPEAERQPFLDALLDAVRSAPAFTLVLTLRADFYGYALSHRRFSDALQDAVYNLGPMSREELQAAIVQPAAQMQVKLEPGLKDKLIQATWGHAGRLPLLEFALTELWLQQQAGWLTHQAYDAIGGVEQALANHAETIYAQLHPVDQQRVQRIFVQLVEPGTGTAPSRRLATPDEVGALNWDLVSHLASERLVVTNRNEATGEETVEIVHEALIRSWGRLERWLQMDGEFRRWQEELRRARRQWEESDREEEALLRGKRLSDAKYWYDSRQDELSSRDRQFIQLSLTLQERENKRRKRRRQSVIYSLLISLIVALILVGIAFWQWQNSAISEVKAIYASSNANFIADKRLDALLDALQAEQKLKALAWADADTGNQAKLALRQAISRADEQNRLLGHDGGVAAVVFSRDGQLIVSASQDYTVKFWNRDGSLIRTLKGHDGEIWGIAISPDSQLVASASNDHTVKLWNRDGSLRTTLKGHNDEVNAVAFSPDGQLIASASSDQTITLWNRDGSLRTTLKGHEGRINAVAFSPDGQTIASASEDKTIKLWNRDGSLRTTLKGHTADVRGVTFSPDGQLIASASSDETIKLWQSNGTLVTTLFGHGNRVHQVAFSSDSQLFASASADKTVILWNRSGDLLKTFKGHSDSVMGVAFSPDNQTIASASLDSTIKIWKLKNPLLSTLKGHNGTVWDLAFSPDGQLIASASADKTLKLWQTNGALLSTLKGHKDIVYGVAFSPDSQIIASVSRDTTIKLWQRNGSLLMTLEGHKGWVNRIAFSPDGQLIASASSDKTVKLWQSSGALQSTLTGHKDRVWGVAFSPDGKLIASASNDKTVKLWKRDGTYIKTLTGHSRGVNAVVFSPDGQLIASASDDKTVKIWKQDGTLLFTLKGHRDGVLAVAFSPDSQRLASTSIDKTVKLWKRDGSLLSTLNGYSENVTGVAFSVDGQQLASTSVDKSVALWDWRQALDLDTLLVLSCDWVQDYLRTNSEINESDRHLCANVKKHLYKI